MMHEKRQTMALDTTITAIACPTDIPCVKKVFGVCHVATFSAPLETGISMRVQLWLETGLSLQTTRAKEIEPTPRPTTWGERNQITVAPRSRFFIVSHVCLKNGRLADLANAFEGHIGVSN